VVFEKLERLDGILKYLAIKIRFFTKAHHQLAGLRVVIDK
jgi:hypothetical protein